MFFPTKLSEYLLRLKLEWTADKLAEAMNSGIEKFMILKNSVTVIITYYTAWVDGKGLQNFRDDIY